MANSDGFATAIATDHFEGVLDAADHATMARFGTMAEAEVARAVDIGADPQVAVRVIWDYGLTDCWEAPQFHKPVM